MINQISVKNFKALRDVTVDLERFTVLIGPNDTGKSSFLEALFAIAESKRSPVSHCFWSSWQERELVYRQLPEVPVVLAAQLSNKRKATYQITLNFVGGQECRLASETVNGREIRSASDKTTVSQFERDRRTVGKAEPELLQRIATHLQLPCLARWSLEDLASPSRLSPERKYPLDPSGYGLATCIAEMKLYDVQKFFGLLNDFRVLFPNFKDIRIKRANVQAIVRDDFFQRVFSDRGEGYALFLVQDDDMEIPATLASGGTLVTLAFLALVHMREPRKLLLIEEPENGLHPARLKEIVGVLRKLVQSQPDVQVVLTTHSPLLLDYVAPDEVRIFVRNKERDNDIEVYKLAHVPDIYERLKYLMLGELVYNEGEQELVKEITHAHSDSR